MIDSINENLMNI